MRVSRIEIFGFKSFMDRIVLPLDGGVTGVVGPNGCGKSNIVDSLRWVMGETKASALRGGTLEDVIFNGTDKLRPLGLAEVTITVRASGDNFFADLANPQRAQIFAAPVNDDTSKGTPVEEASPAESAPEEASEGERPKLVVMQGGAGVAAPEAPTAEAVVMDGLQSASAESELSPEEVAAVLEVTAPEAGGEGQDQNAGAVAPEESSIDDDASAPQALLARFSWLRAVSEVQVTRRLYRSGESEYFINRVACRLKDVRDFFRAVGIGARGYTIVAQGEVSRIVTAKAEDRRQILEEAAGVLGFRDKITAAARRLEETSVNVSRLMDLEREVGRQVASLKRQAARAEARAELKARVVALDTRLSLDRFTELFERRSAVQQTQKNANASESAAVNELQAIETREQAARGELMTIDVQGDELRRRIDAIREELNGRSRERQNRESRIKELRAFALARETEIKRLHERRSTVEQRLTECRREIDELKAKDEAITQQIRACEQSNEDELRRLGQQLEELRGTLRQCEHEFRERREQLVSNESRLQAIREQLIAASPVNQLKKTLGEKRTQMLAGFKAGLFLDGLTVPTEYTKAVQSILAEKGQFLVSERAGEIARVFVNDILAAKNDLGLGLGVFQASVAGAPGGTPSSGSAEIPFKRVLDVVTVRDDCRFAAERVFANIYIAGSLEEALSFFETKRAEAQQAGAVVSSVIDQVTLVTPEGDSVTNHSFFSLRHEGGLIQLKNRAAELQTKADELKAKVAELTTKREQLQRSLSETESQHAAALRESRARQAQVRDLSNQQGNVRGRLHSSTRLLDQLASDQGKVAGQVADAEARIAEYLAEEERVKASLVDLVPERDTELNTELTARREEYAKIDEVRRAGHARVSELSNALHACRQKLDSARSSLGQAALELQKIELESGSIRDRITNEYGGSAEGQALLTAIAACGSEGAAQMPERLQGGDRAQMSEELQKIRSRIAREGEVDPTSIEQHRVEQDRLDDLVRQRGDLEEAAATLKRTIGRLTEMSERRFVQMFEAVRKNFSRLVPRLFGGGMADLELLDPAHPLDSGVEIIARPPGKKLKSIELLSGGEKALCATALIFAMFLERPSPLCVLDEVDAPLDEANLMRYLALIKDMSTHTQFLMITHNKNSMSMANNLVGITMQEPGSSKLMSVSLQEAYQQVA